MVLRHRTNGCSRDSSVHGYLTRPSSGAQMKICWATQSKREFRNGRNSDSSDRREVTGSENGEQQSVNCLQLGSLSIRKREQRFLLQRTPTATWLICRFIAAISQPNFAAAVDIQTRSDVLTYSTIYFSCVLNCVDFEDALAPTRSSVCEENPSGGSGSFLNQR